MCTKCVKMSITGYLLCNMSIRGWISPFAQCGCALSGLPGGARAPAWVPAEEHRNREQEAKGPTGGAAEPQHTGEEGAGGHSPGAPGAAVSFKLWKHAFIGLVEGWFDCFIVMYCVLVFVRTSLIPCDSNHLAKNLSIPLVNQWPTLQPYNSQDDVKLFRRFVSYVCFMAVIAKRNTYTHFQLYCQGRGKQSG